ncbi:MAG TPA: zf-HC2 domain-containing protein [Candidatus Saccharimonadales bacterium]|nr:zf-HC2 domain-containing protein [Candidatus Saccharimonadales bacterium]
MKPLHPFEDWILSAYAAGDLPAADSGRVARHLEGCADCQARVRELARVREELRGLPPAEPTRDLWPAISQRLNLPAAARSAVSRASRPAAADAGAARPAAAAACAERLEPWRLSAYLDGDLDATHRTAVEHHLAGCPVCRARVDELQALVSGLKRLPAPEPPAFLWARVQAGLRQARPVRGRGPGFEWVRWLPAGMAAAAALAVVVWLGQERRPTLPGAPARQPAAGAVAARPQPSPEAPGAGGAAGAVAAGARPSGAGVFGDSAPTGPTARADLPVSQHYTEAARRWLAGLTSSARGGRNGGENVLQTASTPGAAGMGGMDDVGPDPDPKLSDAIRSRLEQLDADIRETQTNLALNPGNERVQAAAWSAYMAKVDYLRSLLGRRSSGSGNRTTVAPGTGASQRDAA